MSSFLPPTPARVVRLRSPSTIRRWDTTSTLGVVIRAGFVVLTAIVSSACGGSPRPVDADPAAVVTEVVDGDTIEIAVGDVHERVRLLGIDAPESVHPTVPEQCFGAEASAAMTSLLPPGTLVRLERDQQARDHFGRLLLYVFRSHDGLSVNLWMVEHGLADVAFYEPNVHYRSDLTAAKRRARRQRRGLWSTCDGPDQPLQ